MRRFSARLFALMILSGLLQVFSFPIAGQVPAWRTAFCWISLVPLLYGLTGHAQNDGKPLTTWQGAGLGYLCGIAWYLGNCSWIYRTMNLYGGLPPVVSAFILLLFAMYLGLYHALFGAALVALRRSSLGAAGALVFAPFTWVAIELARARITGFPWDLLGNSQVDNLLLTRLATVGGVMSMSFVIVMVNCLLAGALVLRSRRRAFAAAGVFGALALQLGGLVAAHWIRRPQPHDFAVLMQENLEVGAVGREVAPLTTDQMYAAFGGASLHPEVGSRPLPGGPTQWTNAGPAPRPVMVVWPEAPAGFFSSDSHFRQAMASLARTAGVPMVIGSLGVDRDASVPRGYRLYDSASLFSPDGSYAGRYDKIHLVPWGEYVPFKDLFFFASKLTAGVGNMDPGTERAIFQTGGHSYGVFICYESIFGDEVRQFVKNGAEVLINISDDGWYGDTGAPWQHLNMARMRAIENHRWVVRDTNTGVTTTIDPLGQTWLEAPRHVRGAYLMPFEYEQGTTFYTRYGDWFAGLCVLVTLGALGFARLRRG